MSEDGKRGVGHRPQATAPILDSTLLHMGWSTRGRFTLKPDHHSTALLMRWTAPHKASKCRRVIVEDESPERAVHDKNYHHRARPCKEGVPNPRRRCQGQGRRGPEAQTQGGVGVLR